MAKTRLSEKATYVARGYGQVEPNLLSAQKTGQIYAQLPAAADIDILENGQFATYNYAAADGGQVDFEGDGEWMMVFNEIKLYRDFEQDCDFAMKKENYVARVYSPIDGTQPLTEWQARFYGPLDSNGNPIYLSVISSDGGDMEPGVYEVYWSKSGVINQTRVR